MKIKGTIVILLVVNLWFIFSCKKDSTFTTLDTPAVSYSKSVSIVEDNYDLLLQINVNLSHISDSIVEIHYSTEDSSAVNGDDYVGVPDGILTFKPGEKSKTIPIQVKANTNQKKDLIFFVNLNSATHANLEAGKVWVKIINVDYATLVWSDEFDGTILNTTDWNFELGNNNGWGNNELEIYTNSSNNVFLESGYLNIKAIKNVDNTYTSARITTSGKRQFTHCRVDILAKLPEGKGLWPALWMLGSNISSVGWPTCGELDMVEVLGDNTKKTYGTAHWYNTEHKSSGGNYTLTSGSFSSGFHLFTFIWTPNNLKWLVDSIQYYTVDKATISGFPMDLPEFFIFNVAVGGNWPGSPSGTTVFPQSMLVDYIRVYQ
jgi:beta-glucanase (GH16 family)